MGQKDFDNFSLDDSRKWGLIGLIFGGFVAFFLSRFMPIDRAIIGGLLIGLLLGVIRFYMRLHNRFWFWVLMAIIAIADIAGAFFFPHVMGKMSIAVFAPLGVANFALCIFLVSKIDEALECVHKSK